MELIVDANTLLDNLYRILKDKNMDYIQALVEVNQKQTREFWKRRGFKEENKFVWIEKYI
jgi:ribosomal protein S18 acetylase RimI-like enzyme